IWTSQYVARLSDAHASYPVFVHRLARLLHASFRPRLQTSDLAAAIALAFCYPAGSARGISPRAAHRSGREPRDSSGSCHPEKAAAFRQDVELLRLPVDSFPT